MSIIRELRLGVFPCDHQRAPPVQSLHQCELNVPKLAMGLTYQSFQNSDEGSAALNRNLTETDKRVDATFKKT